MFNFEGGCYAKCIRLSAEAEPQIHAAIRFGSVLENVVMDPASRAVDYDSEKITENTRATYPVDFIPGCVLEGLSVIESLVRSADGSARLKLHPRCTRLTAAFLGYARARRSGQWMDYPADPQHPWEDLIDALRGGLSVALPEGTSPAAAPLRRARADRVF